MELIAALILEKRIIVIMIFFLFFFRQGEFFIAPDSVVLICFLFVSNWLAVARIPFPFGTSVHVELIAAAFNSRKRLFEINRDVHSVQERIVVLISQRGIPEL